MEGVNGRECVSQEADRGGLPKAKVRSSDLVLRIIKMLGRYDLNRCATTNKQMNERINE